MKQAIAKFTLLALLGTHALIKPIEITERMQKCFDHKAPEDKELCLSLLQQDKQTEINDSTYALVFTVGGFVATYALPNKASTIAEKGRAIAGAGTVGLIVTHYFKHSELAKISDLRDTFAKNPTLSFEQLLQRMQNTQKTDK